MAANDGSRYNEIASPMFLFEEGEILTRDELRRRKETIIERKEKKSPFLVGTMAQVSHKISELDQSLQNYTQLVFDSRMSDEDEIIAKTPFATSGSLASAKQKHKAKEEAEMNRFCGVYSIHSAVGQAPERVKYVHKISMKEKKKERKKSADTSRATPKFVELFTFPGFQSSTLTPLPQNVPNYEIFEKVLHIHHKLKRNIRQYDEDFARILNSHMSQAMFVDIYWWVFLERFSSQKSSQPKFFNRISHNFVKFLIHIQDYSYREAILNNYPEIMTQCIYVAFCDTFPDSYKQFGDDFKEFLLQTVYEWMTGFLPAPRKFLKWSPDLEPAGKRREAAMAKKPVKDSSNLPPPADDWLTQLDSIDGMHQRMNKYGSEASVLSRATSQNTSRSRHGRGSESSKSDDSRNIDSVASAQVKSRFPRPQVNAASKLLTPVIEATPGSHSVMSDPIMEGVEEEDGSFTQAPSPLKMNDIKSQMTRKKTSAPKRLVESHPACKGPDMVKCLFDVKGSCPLVAHYLKSYDLDPDSGQRVNVNRTEMMNLPPLNAPTYRDVIKESFKTIKQIEKGIHKHIRRDTMEHSQFVIQQNKNAKAHRQKQALLLNNSKEVKRLSNLLMLEGAAQKEKSEKLAAAEKMDRVFEQALAATVEGPWSQC